MHVSSTPIVHTRHEASTEAAQIKGLGMPRRLAAAVTHCANTAAQPPQAERRGKEGKLPGAQQALRAKQEKYFSRNIPARQPLMNRSGVSRPEHHMMKAVAELNVSETARRDPIYAQQVIDAVYASTYSAAKDAFGRLCVERGARVPDGYLQEIGAAAHALRIACEEKDGIYTPKAAGANPFVTPVLSSMQKQFTAYMNQPGQGARLRAHVEAAIAKEIAPQAPERGMLSPDEFVAQLAEIGKRWEQQLPHLI